MELQVEQLGAAITKVVAVGRWDVAGAAAVDMRLAVLSGSGRSLIIDLAQVTFLSSMGIRSIVMAAKAVQARRARIVLLAPAEAVALVLTSTGIDTLVPIHDDIDAALAAVEAGA
jgi:anti-anti-sigma factor